MVLFFKYKGVAGVKYKFYYVALCVSTVLNPHFALSDKTFTV